HARDPARRDAADGAAADAVAVVSACGRAGAADLDARRVAAAEPHDADGAADARDGRAAAAARRSVVGAGISFEPRAVPDGDAGLRDRAGAPAVELALDLVGRRPARARRGGGRGARTAHAQLARRRRVAVVVVGTARAKWNHGYDGRCDFGSGPSYDSR